MRPKIRKLGTIDCDLVETTPIVFGERLYRFEYVRQGYAGNTSGDSYFRFVDHETGEYSPAFAAGYHLGNVFVEGGVLVVTGTNHWDGENVDLFVSTDMHTWERRPALHLPGYGLFNTSLCRAGDRYVLMIEVGKPPEIAGVPFTARFAVSDDLYSWRLTPDECNYSRERYTAPHAMRWLDGWTYNFYLEAIAAPDGTPRYEQRVVRSRDLVHWEPSLYEFVLAHDPDDKIIANDALSPEQRARIAAADDWNNSDIDFCEFQGQTRITYSWGNQQGNEFLAEALFDGTEADFLRGWFEA